MRFLRSLSAIASILTPLAHAAFSDSQITVYAWPVSAASPVALAEIKLSSAASTPSSSASEHLVSASLLSYTPPSIALSKDELVRIGLYDPSTKAWIGSATSALSFAPQYDRKILLHMDEDGKVFHVGFTAAAALKVDAEEDTSAPGKKEKKNKKKQKKSKQSAQEVEGQTTIEVLHSSPAPQPALNKPVVLSPDGKADDAVVDNKTFLQK